jgi:hypothetical protein
MRREADVPSSLRLPRSISVLELCESSTPGATITRPPEDALRSERVLHFLGYSHAFPSISVLFVISALALTPPIMVLWVARFDHLQPYQSHVYIQHDLAHQCL